MIFTFTHLLSFFIDRVALAKQGDNRIGSVRPYVRLGVPRAHYTTLSFEPFDLRKEQRRVIISPRCLSVCRLSRADAVDQLLIPLED